MGALYGSQKKLHHLKLKLKAADFGVRVDDLCFSLVGACSDSPG